jgi:hypothetical protein
MTSSISGPIIFQRTLFSNTADFILRRGYVPGDAGAYRIDVSERMRSRYTKPEALFHKIIQNIYI